MVKERVLQNAKVPLLVQQGAPNSQIFILPEHQVNYVLKTVNFRKAAGPDGVPGKVLKAFAN